MTTLSEAEKVRLGSGVVSRVYVGSEMAWPLPMPGLKLWYDASSLALADGATVTEWPNLVAGGPPLSLVGSPAPVKRNNGLNGRPVVRFASGAGGLKQASGTGVDRDHTLLVVARMWVQPRVGCSVPEPKLNHLLGYWGGKQDVAHLDSWMNNGYAAGDGPAATTNWKLYGSDGSDPYLAAVLADAPIVYYRMNELSGTVAADSSGNNRHATYGGGPTLGSGISRRVGPRFLSTEWTTRSRSPLPSLSRLAAASPSSIGRTVATADVRSNATFQMPTVDDTANRILTHAPWSDNNIYWDYGNISAAGRLSTPYTPALDKWTLVHLTYDAATGKRAVSFDGVEVASAVVSAIPAQRSREVTSTPEPGKDGRPVLRST